MVGSGENQTARGGVILFGAYITAVMPRKGRIEMKAQTARAGLRAFGRAILSPLADVGRTVEFAAHAHQQVIRTDALPERRERRVTR